MRMRNTVSGLFATVGLVSTLLVGAATAAHADDVAPSIVSAGLAEFTVGSHTDSFTVQTTGVPTASISETGTLPSGVSFTDNLDGTATITGSADQGSQGTYPLTITASNGVAPDATQDF